MNWKVLAPGMALVAACAVQHPQNAEEFRQFVPASSFAKVQTFEVRGYIGRRRCSPASRGARD